MINAKELKIGNLLYVKGISGTLTDAIIGKVEVIDNSQEIITLQFDTLDDCSYDKLFPIPLTEDILLNEGFEKNLFNIRIRKRIMPEFDIYSKNGYIVYSIKSDNTRIFSIVVGDRSFEIRYVHEFQNLWYLIEKKEIFFNNKK